MHAHTHGLTHFISLRKKNPTIKKNACCDFKNERIEQLWVINRLIRVDKMKVKGAEHSLI